MADATAAEVADSVRQYDEALRSLSGYRIVLDLLAADHFEVSGAKALVSLGKDLDLTDREHFVASLGSPKEQRLVAEVEALAHRPDLRFFHWEIEFPEVFFGFTGVASGRIQHRERTEDGSAGFDAIVGNPPYVRQETLKPLKPHLKETFQTYDSTNDLYVFFQEIEIRNLRAQGRMGMIVANKWMRSGYGQSLRGYLRRVAQPLEVIDFGHSPIFPDADTFPCILLVAKRPSPLTKNARTADDEEMVACEVPRDRWSSNMDLIGYVNTAHYLIPTKLLRDEGWSLEVPEVQALLEKIRGAGVPLREYAAAKPLRGVLTGLNEAFIIDATTRDRLVRADVKSQKVIRPLLRGRDAARWKNRDSGSYLITIPSSENVDWPWSEANSKAEEVFRKTYPAIFSHFLPFKADLIKRQDQGRYYWELRSCDYMQEFDKPKIIWQEIQFHSWYCWDDQGSIVNNKVFFVPTSDLALLGVLCSPLQWWHLTRVLPHMKDEALSPAAFLMENVRITTGSATQGGAIREVVTLLIELAATQKKFDAEVVSAACRMLDSPALDGKVVAWLLLTPEVFSNRMFKLAGQRTPNSKLAHDIVEFHQKQRSRQVEMLTRQLGLERKLATLVEDAYGLTPEERALLRSTRPVRDPLDVLEAKIRGGEVVEDSPSEA